jgi:hypothetical protein
MDVEIAYFVLDDDEGLILVRHRLASKPVNDLHKTTREIRRLTVSPGGSLQHIKTQITAALSNLDTPCCPACYNERDETEECLNCAYPPGSQRPLLPQEQILLVNLGLIGKTSVGTPDYVIPIDPLLPTEDAQRELVRALHQGLPADAALPHISQHPDTLNIREEITEAKQQLITVIPLTSL